MDDPVGSFPMPDAPDQPTHVLHRTLVANDPAEHVTPDLSPDSRTLRSLIEGHGGFTLRLPTGSAVSSGISVACRPSVSLSFQRDSWSDARVNAWIQQVLHPTQWRTTCIGGWLDPRSDEVHLDVVTVVPRTLERVAVILGRAFGQHCVFDLTNHETLVLR